jgi:hypothetical protein
MRQFGPTSTVVMVAAGLVLLGTVPAAGAVSITVGSASGVPGFSVAFQVVVSSGGAQVGGVQNVIAFDPATPISSCTLNPVLASLSGWSLQPQGCTPLSDCTQANFVIVSFGSTIPDGTLYQCEVQIAAGASGGHYPLACSGARASDPTGQDLAVECASGAIDVVAPTLTPTVTPTPTPTPMPSFTPTLAGWWREGGCQVNAASGGAAGWCWLAVGIVLLWRQRVRRGNRTTSA